MMNSLTKISRRKLCQKLIIRLQSNVMSTSSTSSDICIPNRIERGPTDILKALESTISRDYTAPRYKFHDDPYLTPLSNNQNRTYALAREAGKKAAIWIQKEHSDLFQHKVAEPEIKAFVPPPVYTEESKVTEETLLYEISNGNVTDSVTIHDLLKGEITVPTKQALLELLCFYNNSEPTSTELLETRWYQQSQKRSKNTWINRPLINILFESLKKEKPAIAAAAYNAMICGLAKYFSAEKALQLYTECQGNDVPLCIDGYNAIISLVPLLREGNDKLKMITDIYSAMVANGISPNIRTFNAALNTAVTLQTNRLAIDFVRNTFVDIRKFRLKPSLTTYYHVLRVLNKSGDEAHNSFIKILQSLKEENLIVQDTKDINFFITAMELASRQFCDRKAGEMVNELLLTGDNYKFIGDNYRETIYYRAYLELILATEEFETFFKIYDKLVPHVTITEPTMMNAILQTLQLHPAETVTQYIPKLWSHMIMFGHLDRQNLLENILYLISVHCKPAPDSSLNTQFAEMALTIWDHTQTQNARRLQNITMSSAVIGNTILLLLRGDNFDKAAEVVSTIIESPHLIIGTITTECINEIFELSLAQAHVPVIFTLLKYVTSSGLEGAGQMAQQLYKTIPLTSTQEDMLISLVGADVFKLEVSDKHSSQ